MAYDYISGALSIALLRAVSGKYTTFTELN